MYKNIKVMNTINIIRGMCMKILLGLGARNIVKEFYLRNILLVLCVRKNIRVMSSKNFFKVMSLTTIIRLMTTKYKGYMFEKYY